MKIKFEEQEFTDVKDMICGFIKKGEGDALKYNFAASPDLTFNTAMQLLQTMTHNLLTAFISQKPEAKQDVYDAYNFMASSILNNIMPEENMGMDISEEAILKTEEELITSRYDSLSADEKERADEHLKKLRLRLKQGIENNKKQKALKAATIKKAEAKRDRKDAKRLKDSNGNTKKV